MSSCVVILLHRLRAHQFFFAVIRIRMKLYNIIRDNLILNKCILFLVLQIFFPSFLQNISIWLHSKPLIRMRVTGKRLTLLQWELLQPKWIIFR